MFKRFATILALALVLCTGCGRPKTQSASDGAVSKFRTTALPVPPPAPDVEPIKVEIGGAQRNVQSVLNAARASDAPIAAQAVPALTEADARLTTATALAEDLSRLIAESERIHASIAKITQGDLSRLADACKTDGASASKQIEVLERENQKLRDEELNSAKRRLYGLGIILLLAGAGGVVSMFMLGFTPGILIAKIAVPLGAICLALASLLQKIIWWTELSLGIGAAITLAICVWHLFWHEPPKKKPKV